MFPNEVLKKCVVVTCCESKRGVVLYDPSKRGFEQRIAVGEVASKIRKDMVSIGLGLLLPYKDKGRGKAAHFIEATRNLVSDGLLSRTRQTEKNETTLGSGIVHP